MTEPQSQPRRAATAFILGTVTLDMLALGITQAAEIYGEFGTVWALMQFVAAPILGALSDRFGRRPVVLGSNFGMALDYALMALAPSLSWLFLGRLTFARFIDPLRAWQPGAPVLLAAALLGTALITAALVTRRPAPVVG